MGDQKFTEIDFSKGCLNMMEGEMHVFSMEMPGGAKLFTNAKTGASYLYTDPETGERRLPLPQDIEILLADGRLIPEFMERARNKKATVRPEVSAEEVEAMDKAAKGRQVILRLYDGSGTQPRLSDNGLLLFMQEHETEILAAGLKTLPAPSSVRRWIKLRGDHGDRPLGAMLNMSGRVPRKRPFDKRMERKIAEEFSEFWQDRDRRDCDVVDAIQSFGKDHNKASSHDPMKIPSDQTIRNRLRRSETGDLYKQKFGEKAFRTKYRTPSDRRLHATEILETAIVDHTVVDTMLVISAKHRTPLGRPTLALMVDVAARAILSFFITFDKPSLHTASQLIKRAVRPKPHLRRRFPDFADGAGVYGLPSTIVYDRAVETIGVSHRDALADLGVEVIYAGAGQPQAKGIIERLFRTLNELLFHRLPGSVSLPASLMREMGYDPATTSVITLEELEELLEEAINVYHYERHSALGISPIQYWMDQNKKVYTLADPSVLDKMAGITIMRTLDRAGVRLNYLQYCCETNVPILLDGMAARQRTQRGKRKGSVTSTVKVKFNPEDISRIYVFNESDNQYYELKCTDPAYAEGTSLWQHTEIRKFAKARHNQFRTPEQRREARMALAASIQAACPELGLKGRRAHKKLQDSFAAPEHEEDPIEEADDLRAGEIHVAPAALTRADGGLPQHSPQRGKTARRRNASKRTAKVAKVKAAPAPAGLIAMTEEHRAAAEAGWRAN